MLRWACIAALSWTVLNVESVLAQGDRTEGAPTFIGPPAEDDARRMARIRELWSMGEPAYRHGHFARFGNKNWAFDLSIDLILRYGQGEDELGRRLDDQVIDFSPSLDVELNWLEDWLENAFNERFQVQLTAAEEDFRAGDGLDDDLTGPAGADSSPSQRRFGSNSSLRLRQERLTFTSGPDRLIIDLNNGAIFLGALTAPVTGLRQVLGPSLGLDASQSAQERNRRSRTTVRRPPIVTPVGSDGVTKAVYVHSFKENRSLSRRRRTTDGVAVSVALERYEPNIIRGDGSIDRSTTVDRPIEVAAWRTATLFGMPTRLSALYSWGNANGPGEDIRSWGVGAVSTAGRWQFGGSYADHGPSLRLDPDTSAYGLTYGLRRRFAGPTYPLTIALSGAYTYETGREYRAYGIGGEWRVRSGMVLSLDVSTFNDESIVDDDYGVVVMGEIRIRPRWGSMCRLTGLYVNGRNGAC